MSFFILLEMEPGDGAAVGALSWMPDAVAYRLTVEHGHQLRLTFPDHSARAGNTSRLISGGGRERALIRGFGDRVEEEQHFSEATQMPVIRLPSCLVCDHLSWLKEDAADLFCLERGRGVTVLVSNHNVYSLWT